MASGRALVAAGVRLENSCYHYQQTVEKSLKAVLVHQGVAFPSTHDLNVLILLLPSGLPELPQTHDIPELTIYSTQRRYEEGPTPATIEDATDAENMAASALAWAKAICK